MTAHPSESEVTGLDLWREHTGHVPEPATCDASWDAADPSVLCGLRPGHGGLHEARLAHGVVWWADR